MTSAPDPVDGPGSGAGSGSGSGAGKPGRAARLSHRAPAAPWLLATFFGVGLAPIAPGTVATLAAVPVHLALWTAGGAAAVAVAAAVLAVAGALAATSVESSLGYHDPSEVVVDEVAGYLTAMLALPPDPWILLAAFVLFRALDILKPWPASAAERLPGGWGIVADDLVCGLMACAAIHLARGLLWR